MNFFQRGNSFSQLGVVVSQLCIKLGHFSFTSVMVSAVSVQNYFHDICSNAENDTLCVSSEFSRSSK